MNLRGFSDGLSKTDPIRVGPRAGQVQVEERNTGTPLLLDVAATDSSNEAMAMRWLFSMGKN